MTGPAEVAWIAQRPAAFAAATTIHCRSATGGGRPCLGAGLSSAPCGFWWEQQDLRAVAGDSRSGRLIRCMQVRALGVRCGCYHRPVEPFARLPFVTGAPPRSQLASFENARFSVAVPEHRQPRRPSQSGSGRDSRPGKLAVGSADLGAKVI